MKRRIIFSTILLVVIATLLSHQLYDEPNFELQMDKSTQYVGVQRPHDLGFTGDGIMVAVIDTGVNYNHPDLLGLGHGGKVAGGYDFVKNTQDPMDENGHGTEVAGIIAANGIMRGVAPDAKILAYRVSDTGASVSSELIINAIRKATEDGANVINISLGVNRTNERIDDAINDAVRKGVVVVVAAGNSGPDLSTIGSPGKDPHAITVGATYNNITASFVATLQVDGKRLEVLPMIGTNPTSQIIEGEIIFGKYGRVEDLRGINAEGKILLVERGSDKKDEMIYFSTKERNAADIGAKAVIIYNNDSGIFLGDLRNKEEGPDYRPRIPALSMSGEDGLGLRAMLQNSTIGKINMFYHPDFVSLFSSRGPVSPFYIKPDLVAPGVFVNATSLNGYNLTSGTSFAAPHVSGAVALLLQKNPTLTPSEVASIITTTSDPIKDTLDSSFPYYVSGAGRLNVTKAFDADIVITPNYAILDLSPFSKTATGEFVLKSLSQKTPIIDVKFDFEHTVADFDYTINDGMLQIRAHMLEHKDGTYQGRITVFDGNTPYNIPLLLRISSTAVDVVENDGMLEFSIDSLGGWSYAKISVFNSDSRIVGTTSITPTKHDRIPIYEPGTYWIQAEIKSGDSTENSYNKIDVIAPAQKQLLDFGNVGLPQQQTWIIVSVVLAMVVVGIVIKIR
jgi:minor extracellular serine protease Vpr